MDLTAIITTTRHYNFHTHTQYCDGHDTMDTMARRAVADGFTHLGFSPHSPIAIPSPCNMRREDVDAYRAETARLGRELPLQVYAGMEIDYLGPDHGPASPYFRDLGLDYAIGSVHFIPNQRGEYIDIDGSYERFARNMKEHFRDDLRYVVSKFYEQSSEMLDRGGFDILGHLDKVAQNAAPYAPGLEDEGWYADLTEAFIDKVSASGVTVEINTKGIESHGRFFPHERYWCRLAESGVRLMVNSDAHYAARLTAGRDEAFAMLDRQGYGS